MTKRRVMLYYPPSVWRARVIVAIPPIGSVWQSALGPAWIVAHLRSEGYMVLQRSAYIEGVEHVLRAHGGVVADEALAIFKSNEKSAHDIFRARKMLEGVSLGIRAYDKFVFARNNIYPAVTGYDGTIKSLLERIGTPEARARSVWYDYNTQVEVPIAQTFQPDLYGISINDERQLIPGFLLAAEIKRVLPKTLVVMGGNFFSRMHRAFRLPAFAKLFDFCDAIVHCEGFQPLTKLAETLNVPTTAGVVYRRRSGRVMVKRKPGVPSSFEHLPTPHFDHSVRPWCSGDLFPLYTMSRCPHDCRFCSIWTATDDKKTRRKGEKMQIRFMSPRRIAAHMKVLAPEGGAFDFVDETMSIARQLQLGEYLRKTSYAATWQCYLTITQDMLVPERCRMLYEAGCRCVQLGLETLSTKSLVRENKKWNKPEAYGQILRNLREAGIQTHIFIMVGIPGEKVTDTLRWLGFLKRYGRYVLTIKATRYRVARVSPEERIKRLRSRLIELQSDDHELRLNRDFKYVNTNGRSKRKDVEAALILLEEACRNHWAYAFTSTVAWWTNRRFYDWETMEQLGLELPLEPETPHLREALTRAESIVKTERGEEVSFHTFDDVVNFFKTV